MMRRATIVRNIGRLSTSARSDTKKSNGWLFLVYSTEERSCRDREPPSHYLFFTGKNSTKLTTGRALLQL